MTTGLITGEAAKNTTARCNGMPFFTMLRKTGTDAQSHTGRIKPERSIKNMPPKSDLGMRRSNDSRGMKT